ncbi:baseplate assembly protein [Tianweitania sediminis]|uniref:Baseplate assembly protein n=1 Tax=Tianweitania sediminis TaxID=1502156 RepID=A0A8J7R4M2_9HYPH|nr:baseplate assembly protein [Tianweitania sediminis]MBP0440686.1 baseplate assembly protein [Tianweitania sediminis]
MYAALIDMKADLEMLKTAFGNSIRIGPVEMIDAKKGYRLKLGEGSDGPFLSPWYPHPETGKTSIPLKKGQIVGVVNPSGDMRQGLVFRGGYSGEHKSPNENMAANVFEDAGVRIEVADGALVITVGGVTFNLSGAGLSITGGRVEHDGKNIGSNHVHSGILRGGANTDPPAN